MPRHRRCGEGDGPLTRLAWFFVGLAFVLAMVIGGLRDDFHNRKLRRRRGRLNSA